VLHAAPVPGRALELPRLSSSSFPSSTWHRANGTLQKAPSCPGAMGSDNYFTANDTMEMMSRLWQGSLLTPEKRGWLLGWLTKSHREGFGAWIIDQLPEWTQPTVHHKPGWLSPHDYPGYAISNDIGIVEIGGGKAYAISTLSSNPGDAWIHENRQTQMLEYASCVVFHAMTRDVADPFAPCWHP
jgi:hypothetical protein